MAPTKAQPTSVTLVPEVKAALVRAAQDDHRSISSKMEVILRRWLIENGYLPADPPVR